MSTWEAKLDSVNYIKTKIRGVGMGWVQNWEIYGGKVGGEYNQNAYNACMEFLNN